MLGNLAVFELKGLLPAWLLATFNKPLPPEAYKTSKSLQRNPESLKPKTFQHLKPYQPLYHDPKSPKPNFWAEVLCL